MTTKKITVNVTAHFSFTKELDLRDDEEGLSWDEESLVVDEVQQALASFAHPIDGVPVIDIDTDEP